MNPLIEPAGSSQDRRIADLTILYEVSRALQNTLNEEEVLYTILVGATHGRGLGFNRAFLLLIDQTGQTLEGRLAIGPSSPEEASVIWKDLREQHRNLGELLQEIPGKGFKRDLQVNQIVSRFRIPLSDPHHPLTQIMRSRAPCVITGGVVVQRGLPIDAQTLVLLGNSDFAAVPLFLADHEIGLLIADNAITRAAIEIGSVRLLQIYAQAASTAIQNTALHRQLTERITDCERANHTLRESQQRLLHAERLSTIGEMAALLAHEIRTPLVSIGGFARKLLRTMESGDPRREELTIIAEEVGRLELMIGEVLDYSRAAKLELEDTDINALLRSVLVGLDETLQKASVELIFVPETALPPAKADRFQLRQALINLITNAVDAMPGGGSLTVTTTSGRDFLEVEIADTGIGIAQENWKSLFAPLVSH
jgi:hypothetical protein